jgi:hypothetical protein
MPDDLALSPENTLAEAQRLFDAGRAFQAHEVLESTWKGAPEGRTRAMAGAGTTGRRSDEAGQAPSVAVGAQR